MSQPCYNMYIYNRNGICLNYTEWSRGKPTANMADEQKTMFGLLFTLKTFASAMDPTTAVKGPLGAALAPGQGCSFHSFKTNTYKLHLMETPSGIKLVLNTDPAVGDLREALQHIYSAIYVEYVVKNPLYKPGEKFESELFTKHLNNFVRTLSA